ncbi:hypothetical protein [Chryseobacterium caseinilyticum]|uniref:Uncharacterized protein n=1 Tax=Chryseobacterium caseinilyticum TaxID=2771428 RepID=A0ABR8ZEU9_9FLAO|nr:hypothetical protein [Chryseobacterium caseinilyticum]MBD8083826.1 hypothetical protein [Chryseobacterium caseinilyticum]
MIWQGRNDDEELLHHRIFQRVKEEKNYDSVSTNYFVFHGFTTHNVYRRNRG